MEFPPPPPPPPEAAPPAARRPSRIARGPWLAIGIAAMLVLSIGAVVVLPTLRTGEYSFLERRSDGSPVRWDPCAPIHYETNLKLAPQNEFDDVSEAIGRISAATGIRFVYDGPSSALPPGLAGPNEGIRTPPGETWAPLLIVWLDHKQFDELGGNDSLAAFAHPIRGPDGLFYVSGYIAVNGGAHLLPGFGLGPTWGPVLLHELGHIMGLGHVPATDELMYPQENPIVNGFGKGDLEGLKLLGRTGTCPSGS